MKILHGIGASKGIAIGKITLCLNIDNHIEKKTIIDVEAELARLDEAKKTSVEALNAIYAKALKRVGEANSMIFQIHIMMLQDEDFYGAIQTAIREEKLNAEYAVWQAGQQFSEMFSQMDDEYMRGRASDVIDISKRLIRNLDTRLANGLDSLSSPTIVAAADLMPSETVQMDKEMVYAFVTQEGSKSSHSAILARTMGIPAVVGLADQFNELSDGAEIIVDGNTGDVILEPDEATRTDYRAKQEEFIKHQQELKLLKGTKAITKNGVEMEINANIGHPEDVDLALENDADGIGLFRSEFLYMESNQFPSEEEQFIAYKTVLERMGGKRVIIRTLDLGADKQVPYLNLPHEENPALGLRAIRICLDRQDLFLTQLRALIRASAYGKLAIMFPMIISVDEVRQIKGLVEKVKNDLTKEKIPFDPHFEIGIMIETPASVMLSDELAKEVDFFSIGTNDLTQYTLAVDRMNHSISKLFDSRHPAVLRMIEMAAQSAKKAGIWVGICGESAADTSLTEFYVKIGVRELSVTPSAVLELRRAVQQIDIK
ncbi:phosphoenolpyruvate--protein phosphotransferase [Caproiciproducens galactitolivorans]|uniref:Phosphoenolpyruvate-protein phosphotransferase n=1 Tax=Caproiciproducens galactitolivorans TaxID=642589 RepID=A0A4Z0YD97_9FIRM|nr:phosphoenolpyruvate--protein phosphotransferase [Caproiciproducens galactitolivorans]QEY34718.1 phosphoenolpyruvate--protein phosphotransferase [Caproiciproducens galactitolivorans]TGJ75806.1 phosphoenolpyruvate-protein phosphotransferase [Caproiciproducens galactitolivorans]